MFEACAQAGFTADLCHELGLKYLLANTNGEAWKWKNVKRKTDRDGALKLVRLAHLGELPTVELPETATRQRRAFLNFRQLLVSQRVQLQNHLRSVLEAQGLEAPRGHHAWTAAGSPFSTVWPGRRMNALRTSSGAANCTSDWPSIGASWCSSTASRPSSMR